MDNIRKVISALIVAVITLAGSIYGMIAYYNGALSSKNSQIANLKSKVTSLTGQLTSMTSANLVATLVVTEAGNSSTTVLYPPPLGGNAFTYPFYRLSIEGSVKNTGVGTALNAGLKVVAYSTDGTLEINMTVPLAYLEDFGTDPATNAYVSDEFSGYSGSLQLGTLGSGQTVNVQIDIFHEGHVSNWTVTPVWWKYSP
jgi:hypothetical protein